MTLPPDTPPIEAAAPAEWRELQVAVARLFNESGFVATADKRLALVRGEVNVDVYVVDEAARPHPVRLVIECKHWSKRVDKSVVHGLRTVVNDAGAHGGIIVSRAGFQSGAVAAARSTNVQLFTWTDLERSLVTRWFERYFCPRVADETDAFQTYTEPLSSSVVRVADALSSQVRERFETLRRRYEPISALVLMLMPTSQLFLDRPGWPQLPIRPLLTAWPESAQLRSDVLDATALRPFLDALVKTCHYATADFEGVIGQDLLARLTSAEIGRTDR